VYSLRWYLRYHTVPQVLSGLAIGVYLGAAYFFAVELLPLQHPTSLPGKLRAWLVSNPVCTWLRIRDGWAVWADGGNEEEWKLWRTRWDERRQAMEGIIKRE
jgi:dolichyldiphosphatase